VLACRCSSDSESTRGTKLVENGRHGDGPVGLLEVFENRQQGSGGHRGSVERVHVRELTLDSVTDVEST
jgi:hypothetical protein